MSEANAITIPLINPNEPEALLATLHVLEGEQISIGREICTLETTKSTQVLIAESGGYFVSLQFSEGDTVRAGDVLGYIAATPSWVPNRVVAPTRETIPTSPAAEVPEDLRITQPALTLAQASKLDLSQLPRGQLITKALIQSLVSTPGKVVSEDRAVKPFDPSAILVYGGGGHGKSVIDLLRALGTFRVIGIVDDGLPVGEEIMDLSILGGGAALPGIHDEGTRQAINAVGGIGNILVRLEVFNRLTTEGFVCPSIVHPSAWVEPSARLSEGVQVFPHAYVGSECHVGFGAIVNTGAIISHDCVLADTVNISPGAILAGGVHIGERALVGMGVTVNLGVKIGVGARIGNGATVKSDVQSGGVVRAGSVWPEP